jgi:hypothetical protein
MIPTRTNSWSNSQRQSNVQIYQPSTYFYDLKLAELVRNNQHPPCVHLNSQSLSTDYGFGSSELSSSLSSSSPSSTSTRPTRQQRNIEMGVDYSPPQQTNKSSFISSRECVV